MKTRKMYTYMPYRVPPRGSDTRRPSTREGLKAERRIRKEDRLHRIEGDIEQRIAQLCWRGLERPRWDQARGGEERDPNGLFKFA